MTSQYKSLSKNFLFYKNKKFNMRTTNHNILMIVRCSFIMHEYFYIISNNNILLWCRQKSYRIQNNIIIIIVSILNGHLMIIYCFQFLSKYQGNLCKNKISCIPIIYNKRLDKRNLKWPISKPISLRIETRSKKLERMRKKIIKRSYGEKRLAFCANK